jgi:hypothetical protein
MPPNRRPHCKIGRTRTQCRMSRSCWGHFEGSCRRRRSWSVPMGSCRPPHCTRSPWRTQCRKHRSYSDRSSDSRSTAHRHQAQCIAMKALGTPLPRGLAVPAARRLRPCPPDPAVQWVPPALRRLGCPAAPLLPYCLAALAAPGVPHHLAESARGSRPGSRTRTGFPRHREHTRRCWPPWYCMEWRSTNLLLSGNDTA